MLEPIALNKIMKFLDIRQRRSIRWAGHAQKVLEDPRILDEDIRHTSQFPAFQSTISTVNFILASMTERIEMPLAGSCDHLWQGSEKESV
jgi:hypothetical protein